jgi:hypothetical protein
MGLFDTGFGEAEFNASNRGKVACDGKRRINGHE